MTGKAFGYILDMSNEGVGRHREKVRLPSGSTQVVFPRQAL
jgi:hypothetical protein